MLKENVLSFLLTFDPFGNAETIYSFSIKLADSTEKLAYFCYSLRDKNHPIVFIDINIIFLTGIYIFYPKVIKFCISMF